VGGVLGTHPARATVISITRTPRTGPTQKGRGRADEVRSPWSRSVGEELHWLREAGFRVAERVCRELETTVVVGIHGQIQHAPATEPDVVPGAS